MSPYPESEYSDWDTSETPVTEAEKTPTRDKEPGLTLEELQAAAMKLNLCLVTTPAQQQQPHQQIYQPPQQQIPQHQPQATVVPTMPKITDYMDQHQQPPTAPPRQKIETVVEDDKGNDDDEHDPCVDSNPSMNSDDDDTNLSSSTIPLTHDNNQEPCPLDILEHVNDDQAIIPLDTDIDIPDDVSISDESECITVVLNDQTQDPATTTFVKSEMRFRDIYDDHLDYDSLQVTSGVKNVEENKETIKPIRIEESLKEAENYKKNKSEVVNVTAKQEEESIETMRIETVKTESFAPDDVTKPVEELSTTDSSSETIRADAEAGGKPKSIKKVKAPQPPSGSQTSLVAPTENIVHLSPKQERKDLVLDTFKNVPDTEEEEPSQGKILYKSKGYDDYGDYESVRPTKVNIKESSLEEKMLSSSSDSAPSRTFMKNQDLLLPLIKETATNRLSGSYDYSQQPIRDSHPSSQPIRDSYLSSQPIRETYPPMSPTRIFTYDPSTGISRLRKYDLGEDDRPSSPILERPSSPRVERYQRPASPLSEFYPRDRPTSPLSEEYLGSEPVSSRGCPHCTIHSWLPHSPGCLNRLRK